MEVFCESCGNKVDVSEPEVLAQNGICPGCNKSIFRKEETLFRSPREVAERERILRDKKENEKREQLAAELRKQDNEIRELLAAKLRKQDEVVERIQQARARLTNVTIYETAPEAASSVAGMCSIFAFLHFFAALFFVFSAFVLFGENQTYMAVICLSAAFECALFGMTISAFGKYLSALLNVQIRILKKLDDLK